MNSGRDGSLPTWARIGHNQPSPVVNSRSQPERKDCFATSAIRQFRASNQYAGYPRLVTVRIRAMLSAERGWASGSAALRAGLSSPIGSTCAGGSRAAGMRACPVWPRAGPVLRPPVSSASGVPVKSGTSMSMWTASGPAGRRSSAVAAAPAGLAARVLAGRHVRAGPGRVLVFPFRSVAAAARPRWRSGSPGEHAGARRSGQVSPARGTAVQGCEPGRPGRQAPERSRPSTLTDYAGMTGL
jgi:hypothetical protein